MTELSDFDPKKNNQIGEELKLIYLLINSKLFFIININ